MARKKNDTAAAFEKVMKSSPEEDGVKLMRRGVMPTHTVEIADMRHKDHLPRVHQIVKDCLESGTTPLEVMLSNMRFAHEEAHKMLAEVLAKMEKPKLKQDQADELFNLMRELMRMRGIAQEWARDAAPYVHPKLAQIEVGAIDPDPAKKAAYVTEIKRVIIDHSDPARIPSPSKASQIQGHSRGKRQRQVTPLRGSHR